MKERGRMSRGVRGRSRVGGVAGGGEGVWGRMGGAASACELSSPSHAGPGATQKLTHIQAQTTCPELTLASRSPPVLSFWSFLKASGFHLRS